MQNLNPTTPFAPATSDTAMVRANIVSAFMARNLRFASRFTFNDLTAGTPTKDKKNYIKLMTLLTKLGYRYNGGHAMFGEFVTKVMNFLGLAADPAQIAAVASIYGHAYSSVLPVSYLVDRICLDKAIETRMAGRKDKKDKSSRRHKISLVNLAKARVTVCSWYLQATGPVVDTKMIGMTIYAYSPEIDKVKDLFGKKAIALKVVLIGHDLVVVDHKVTTVDEFRNVNGLSIKPWSRMTTYDIDTDTHSVPFTKVLLALIQNGRINLAQFGIADVATFVTNAFNFGLNTAFKTWMKALKAKNEINPKIKVNTDKLASVADKPVTPETIEVLEDVASIICDDIRTKTTDDQLVAIGASVNGFDLGIPAAFDAGHNYESRAY